MKSRLRVAVVGAGTAGPASALLLSRQGHEVTLFERAPEPSPVGAGITLQPTGLSVLRQLGLLDQILSQGSRIDWLDGRTSSGRVVLDLKYQTLHPALFGLGIHRGSLFQALYGAVLDSDVLVKTECQVASYEERARDVLLRTSVGDRTFDVLVVADGARSSLRQFHPVRQRVRSYEWGALWTVVPAPEGDDFAELSRTLAQVFGGTSRFVGFLPTGLGPEGSPWEGQRIVSLFWSIVAAEMEEFRARGADAFRDEVHRLTNNARKEPTFRNYVARVLDSIENTEQILPATYFDVVMDSPHTERVVFLGDAAHAMSPQLGQGANLALYDSWVLAEVMEESCRVSSALKAYRSLRRSHLTYYQWATRLLTPFFQSDWEVLGWARDLSMGALCRLPFFRRQGLGSMAGYKSGVFSAIPVSYRLTK